jgi:hypothetical protein
VILLIEPLLVAVRVSAQLLDQFCTFPVELLQQSGQSELFSLRVLGVQPPTTGVGEDAGKKEPSYTVGGNVD